MFPGNTSTNRNDRVGFNSHGTSCSLKGFTYNAHSSAMPLCVPGWDVGHDCTLSSRGPRLVFFLFGFLRGFCWLPQFEGLQPGFFCLHLFEVLQKKDVHLQIRNNFSCLFFFEIGEASKVFYNEGDFITMLQNSPAWAIFPSPKNHNWKGT